ncbi:MAG: DUF4956 domain-containing protein [Clostridia bacterium]|nr:DUF4956 domain-containing protein [Clostridia bacterium]
MEAIFQGLFDNGLTEVVGVVDFILCITTSLLLGLILAFAYMYRSEYTKSFLVTLALLPATVCVVIMMVNGNIGAGVAVAGAFSLVRFRSAPGSAKEILAIFLAMGAGLVAGMGYLAYAALFTLLMSAVFFFYNMLARRTVKAELLNKTLKVTIPEDLDYTGVFDDIFAQYTTKSELVKVKSTNMGSMFRLTYNIVLREPSMEKQMLDRIRERNGNLEIMISRQEKRTEEL